AQTVHAHVVAALTHAHARGVVHCDVRPSNIVWVDAVNAQEARAVVIDWGLAMRQNSTTLFRGVRAYAPHALADTAMEIEYVTGFDLFEALMTYVSLVMDSVVEDASLVTSWKSMHDADAIDAHTLTARTAVVRAVVRGDRYCADACAVLLAECVERMGGSNEWRALWDEVHSFVE
ncbi:hypothetical protein EON66_08950, partial [archaeon]